MIRFSCPQCSNVVRVNVLPSCEDKVTEAFCASKHLRPVRMLRSVEVGVSTMKKCSECGHFHKDLTIVDDYPDRIQEGFPDGERMCHWCLTSDYANDPGNEE